MSRQDKTRSWYVFTPHGAFHQSGETAKIALNRFMRVNRGWPVLGIFADELIVKPPTAPGQPPFLCMFMQGNLQPKPPVDEGLPKARKGKG